jgi:hypothetical protein
MDDDDDDDIQFLESRATRPKGAGKMVQSSPPPPTMHAMDGKMKKAASSSPLAPRRCHQRTNADMQRNAGRFGWSEDCFASLLYLGCVRIIWTSSSLVLSSDRFPLFVRTDFHLFGSISICSDRFPFVRFDIHLFGPISICSDRFQFVRTDFHLFGPISICSDRFPLVWIDFHYLFGPMFRFQISDSSLPKSYYRRVPA